MRSYILAPLVALVSLSIAAPIESTHLAPRSNTTGFTVTQVAADKQKLRNGPAELFRSQLKYTKTYSRSVYKAAAVFASVQSGSVTANPEQYDDEYLCSVTIGSTGQTLNLDFDTGSSDLWVFSNLLSSGDQSGHNIYNPSSSSTAQEVSGATWDISYGDGSGASGVVYTDTVTIGGISATMSVEAANNISSAFVSDSTKDGFLGLGFDSMNTCTPSPCKTWMDTIASTLSQQVFTSSLKKGAAGSYDFGFIDSSKYTGDIGYHAISTANGFWEFTLSGYAIGSSTPVTTSIDTVADTGSTLILMPSDVVSAYYAAISGSSIQNEMYVFPCTATPPDFSIVLDGATYTVPGSYMNWAPYTSQNCYGGLQVSSSGQPNILGDVFLKSQFVVWDYGNTQIGFAAQA